MIASTVLHLGGDQIQHVEQPPTLITAGQHQRRHAANMNYWYCFCPQFTLLAFMCRRLQQTANVNKQSDRPWETFSRDIFIYGELHDAVKRSGNVVIISTVFDNQRIRDGRIKHHRIACHQQRPTNDALQQSLINRQFSTDLTYSVTSYIMLVQYKHHTHCKIFWYKPQACNR